MANMSIIEQKAQKVAQIKELVDKSQSVVVFDYRGLTVEEVTNLRNEMRKAGVVYEVIKNGIFARATELDMAEYLKGPSAFAFGIDDPVAPAKILKDAVKKLKKCEIKGGIVNGVVTDAKGIETLADLPSREQLIARLLGSMMSPVSGLAIVLDQIAKKQAEAAE